MGQANVELEYPFALPFLEVGNNFGHFLISHAPKIRHWSREGAYESGGPTVLIEGGYSWQFEILRLLGVPDKKIAVVSRNTSKIFVKRLAVVDEKYIGGRSPSLSLETMQWIRERLLKSVATSTGVESELVYLEREPASRRVVLNSNAVRDLVNKHGGVTVRPIDLSVSDQVALLAGSRTIVGTNGTELVLSIFAKPRASIISIIPPGPHFQGIVPALVLANGHRFYPLIATNSFEASTPGDLRDMHAPIERLDELLRSHTH
jgi:capsular polysaccharide biosynthesis protein